MLKDRELNSLYKKPVFRTGLDSLVTYIRSFYTVNA